LGSSSAGYKFHGERSDAGIGDLLDNLGGAKGPQESDENLAAAKESEIDLAGYII
jgi:hypothetical protein